MPKPDSPARLARSAGFKVLSRRQRLRGYAIMTAIQGISGDVLRAEEGSLYTGAAPGHNAARRIDPQTVPRLPLCNAACPRQLYDDLQIIRADDFLLSLGW